MMIRTLLSSACRVLVIGGLLATQSQAASANALFTLQGTTEESKLASESDIRLSLLGWTEPDKLSAFNEQYKQYQTSKDHAAFAKFLQTQDTQGYLFTKEATGYSIKYAWRSEEAAAGQQKMVMLVIPALKTGNPYMWKTRNDALEPFSVVELTWQGEQALMQSSTDHPIEINAQNRLELQEGNASKLFARLKDATPYYQK